MARFILKQKALVKVIGQSFNSIQYENQATFPSAGMMNIRDEPAQAFSSRVSLGLFALVRGIWLAHSGSSPEYVYIPEMLLVIPFMYRSKTFHYVRRFSRQTECI